MEIFPDIANYLDIFKFISESDPKEMKLFALMQANFMKYYLYQKSLNITGQRKLEKGKEGNHQVKLINKVEEKNNKNHKGICLVITTEAQRIL